MSGLLCHGIDVVPIARMTALLESHGQRARDRLFTPGEQEYAEAGRSRAAERYAARFAAKEAVLKALGTGWSGGLQWTDVEVVVNADGAPTVRLHGAALDLATRLGLTTWALSLSHTEDLAIASVVGTAG